MRPSNAHLATAAVAGLLYLWWRRRRRPTCVVDGCDVYVVDAKDADDVIDRLDGDVLGVDVEWPSQRKPRCAVLQIASRRACVVIRVGSATCLPPRTTLRLKRAICVGVGIREDCQLVLRDVGCACGRQVDLRTLANQRDAGLASLAAEFAPSASLPHKRDMSVRRSDWASELTLPQIEYAAGDAIASYRVCVGLCPASAPLGEWLRAAPVAAAPPAKPRPKPSSTTQNDARALHKQARRRRYEAWHAEHAKSHHYDNIPLVSKSGRLLGLVAKGKADWYCDRGLGARDEAGRVVLDYDPDIIDDDRCITSPRKNECVGCGNVQHLTRFYVVVRARRPATARESLTPPYAIDATPHAAVSVSTVLPRGLQAAREPRRRCFMPAMQGRRRAGLSVAEPRARSVARAGAGASRRSGGGLAAAGARRGEDARPR